MFKIFLASTISLYLLGVAIPQLPIPSFPVGQSGGGGGGGGTGNQLTSSDLTLSGGFRVPAGADDQHSAHYGGYGFGYRSTGNSGSGSLWISGCMQCAGNNTGLVAEISIPTPVNTSTISSMNTATLLTSWTDITGGRLGQISGGDHVEYGGFYDCPSAVCGSEEMLANVWEYYGSQATKTTFIVNVSTLAYSSGPYLIGQSGTIPGSPAYVAGQMSAIPSSWQSALGGDTLTGQCCTSIIGRSSSGPSMTSFTAANVSSSPTGNLLVGYQDGVSNTVGSYTVPGGFPPTAPHLFDAGTNYQSMFVPNTRTIMSAGGYGGRAICIAQGGQTVPPQNGCQALTGLGYGVTTQSSAADNTNCPGNTDSQHDCYYDPTVNSLSGPGAIGYPYYNYIALYDANDLAAVKAGTKKYYQPVPYSQFSIDFPITSSFSGHCVYAPCITNLAIDAAGMRLFLEQYGIDSVGPIIWVYSITTPAPSPFPNPFRFLLDSISFHSKRSRGLQK